MNTVAERIPVTSDALKFDDFQARRKRALLHLGGTNGVTRKFGFYRNLRAPYLPLMETVVAHSKEDKELIQELRLIERYAGYLMVTGKICCAECEGKTIGYREFIFRPLPGGQTYRWPEGMIHYFEEHKAAIPFWMKDLIEDFRKARAQRMWR